MTYRRHGHKPSDAEIAALGYKAFAPARPPLEPTADDWQRASRDLATGDPSELGELADELADLWPAPLPPWWPWGYWFDPDE